MKKHLKMAMAIILLSALGCVTGYSRMIDMKMGSLTFLKQEKQVNLEFVYDGMKVSDLDEKDYVAKKVADLNQKSPGRGDQWRQSWIADRTSRYQPSFEELLNKYAAGKNSGLEFGSFKDAKYTLILKTTFTSEGYNVAVMRRPAFINADAIFVETQSRTNVMAIVTITKAPGADVWGFDYDSGERLQEAYSKAGKGLAALIAKQIK